MSDDRRDDYPSYSDLRFRARRYVCPYLMTFQYWIMLAARRPVYWSGTGALCRRAKKGHGIEVRAWWPVWMILTECWLHNRVYRGLYERAGK